VVVLLALAGGDALLPLEVARVVEGEVRGGVAPMLRLGPVVQQLLRGRAQRLGRGAVAGGEAGDGGEAAQNEAAHNEAGEGVAHAPRISRPAAASRYAAARAGRWPREWSVPAPYRPSARAGFSRSRPAPAACPRRARSDRSD